MNRSIRANFGGLELPCHSIVSFPDRGRALRIRSIQPQSVILPFLGNRPLNCLPMDLYWDEYDEEIERIAIYTTASVMAFYTDTYIPKLEHHPNPMAGFSEENCVALSQPKRIVPIPWYKRSDGPISFSMPNFVCGQEGDNLRYLLGHKNFFSHFLLRPPA
jgi:hypothetical protein